jgi:hypothetical protein
MGRKKVMMQPTLAGFIKIPIIEEIFQPIVDIFHKPIVEIPHEPVGKIAHESVGGISHEPVGPNNFVHGNLDLNVLIEEDLYEHQPSIF